MDANAVTLLLTIAFFTVYVIGVGGTTATAIRIREAWRHRGADAGGLEPRDGGEVVLKAPSVPRALRVLRLVGWVAFAPALVLAIFADRSYPWVSPLVVLLMVAINAFYFTAMQTMGEQLTLEPDGFRLGSGSKLRRVRWIHVTELTGARVGAFSAAKMSDEGDWQDPRLKPNVIFYRLNRALTTSRRSLVHRLIGFTYYDGVIRNAFGVPTEQLLRAMKEWQRLALDAEELPLRPGKKAPPAPKTT
jgi:hypothetical protein